MSLELTSKDVGHLYGGKIFLAEKSLIPAPELISWKLKEDSRVVFVIHKNEYSDRSKTDLLKKIVESLEIPTEQAGFGTILGNKLEHSLKNMPTRFGVVFDDTLNPFTENPHPFSPESSVYFAPTLGKLAEDVPAKRALWEYLKSIKPQI